MYEGKVVLKLEVRQRNEDYAQITSNVIDIKGFERLKGVSNIQRQKAENDSQDEEITLSFTDAARNRLAVEYLKVSQVSQNKERSFKRDLENAAATHEKSHDQHVR